MCFCNVCPLNVVWEQPDYRLAVIFLLQHLTVLDQEKVTAEEKVFCDTFYNYSADMTLTITCFKSQVSAVNEYDPPLEVVAARDHMTHSLYQLMQPQVLYDRFAFINVSFVFLCVISTNL